jgi:hypothetical protein
LDRDFSVLISTAPAYNIRFTTASIVWETRDSLNQPNYHGCSVPSSRYLDDKWHHLAAVKGPSGMRLYLDGVEGCSNNYPGPIYPPYGPFLVGRHPNLDGVGSFFNGQVDDLRLYARALTADEVARLAAGGQ